jgi:LysR family transcriptional regulator, low CO2-responsive transcriptional regulator
LMRLKIPEPRVRVFPTQLAAAAAAVAGDGIALVVEHLVAADLARGALVPTPISGLPEEGRWFVSTVVGDRRSRVASRFRRFLSSPDAMFAMHRSDGGVPVSRFRPPVYVTIWS